MPPEKLGDLALVWEMRSAAREALSFVADLTFEAFVADLMRRRAVERVIEIIGEAARHVSPEFRAAHPDIPWKIIVAQRHILAHDYPFVLMDRIWRVVKVRLPVLVQQLDAMLPPDEM